MKHIKTSAIIISAALILALIFATSKSRASDDTYIVLDLIEYCNEVGEEYGVCPELLEAIIETESSGRADAANGSCKGLMQVNANAHRDRMQKLGISNIYDKKGNIIVATDYLLELLEKYEDIGTVLMVYNGTKNAVRRGEQGDYTRYARKIVQRSRELEWLHGKLDY